MRHRPTAQALVKRKSKPVLQEFHSDGRMLLKWVCLGSGGASAGRPRHRPKGERRQAESAGWPGRHVGVGANQVIFPKKLLARVEGNTALRIDLIQRSVEVRAAVEGTGKGAKGTALLHTPKPMDGCLRRQRRWQRWLFPTL